MTWLTDYSVAAEKTDQLVGKDDHVELLAAGVFGEAGSIFSELKKKGREREAYPAYRNRLVEELGDFLWYWVRLSAVVSPSIMERLEEPNPTATGQLDGSDRRLKEAYLLGQSAGDLFRALEAGNVDDAAEQLTAIWLAFCRIAATSDIDLQEAAKRNLTKIRSRWPEHKVYVPFFDEGFIPEERLPRELGVEFREIARGGTKVVMLRCNELNFGDRLTDNIKDPDYYRYHDVFHFSYAVHLGWSPVIRALLNCKRKGCPDIDRNEDGARAGIIEEAVSAIVFSRAKEMKFFRGIDHVDYDLLKVIQVFVQGYEVERVPLWQWDTAIREGYKMFSNLTKNRGGIVRLNLPARRLTYEGLKRTEKAEGEDLDAGPLSKI